MALNRDFYKAVEDVIGPEYISDDPVVTESYAFPIRAATAPPKDVYQPRYEAVTLPASTKEAVPMSPGINIGCPTARYPSNRSGCPGP